MKLEVLCHDPIVGSILRNKGWRECIDEGDILKLDEILKSLEIPAEITRESDYVRIRVRWLSVEK